ncbi:cyclic pyranopterin monophosphate synthase MoaC [Marinicrinis sediminis]|uniref:Cyclic pyranopterin monophosphate synthase n=1 Tax=Marinicrinis sediminis TaxID=1652465 RepID=A0ABW5R5N1_9BACL
MAKLTHFNEQGRGRMVDVSAKSVSMRQATASSQVAMNVHTWQAIQDHRMEKGDVLAVAQVAGIMAAKQTSSWIPMCHPLLLTGVDLTFQFPSEGVISIQATVKTKGETGVEMEALTAVSAAALTIYDMSKASDPFMTIGPTCLQEKRGGSSGTITRTPDQEEGEGR